MNSKGMTLIELIVVMVLLGIIGLFTFQFIGSSVETYIMVSRQAELLAEAKPAMERMAREIRDAKEIGDVSPSSINFIKEHPALVDTATDITFQLSEGILYRNSELLAENVPVDGFKVTRNPDDENEITLELTLSLTGGEKVTLHTKVYPKNINISSQFDGDWEEVVE
ncbi:MAG: prepilin-type N-terminal cleavage/methylation domain-containing protein [Desulfobacteraceae bacterium]|nr:prepilin-type N-terminal cleavage/methylation domain-containing protein [Desulfobacteraceae bacterium]